MKIELLERGLEVAPLQAALAAHPKLWNEHTSRTADPTSPHHGCDDIWVRFAGQPGESGAQQHESIWYPSADQLGVVPMVEALYMRCSGKRLGGVLITRIPAGRQVQPHIDHGWHARAYEKFAVQVHAAPGQRFCFDDGEELETVPGDVFWFDNAYTHWVLNPTAHDRVTMICCIKR
jgi:hypothetical protein